MELQDKTAIVTGGGRGIGKTIAEAFAREGASVMVAARTREEIEATAAELRAGGAQALAVVTDVARTADVERLVASTVERFGGIDILVNAAAVQGPIGRLQESDPQEWHRTISINLVGTYHCCRVVIPIMIARGGGKIINISGGGSVSPRPFFSAYSCAKAGVTRLTETLAAELRDYNIQVNTMAPGASSTRMTDEIIAAGGAAGEKERSDAESVKQGGGIAPDKQARLAVFLASGESNGLTGRMIHANEDLAFIQRMIPKIMAGDAYTIRRLALPEGMK